MSIPLTIVRAVASFIPSNIAGQLARQESLLAGQEQRSTGAAVFIDIAGFTPMAEQLVRLMRNTQDGAGYRGAEELNRIINRTFTALIEPIHNYGGTVTRFGGDALSAYFANPAPETPEPVIIRALHCASEMQKAIRPLQTVDVEGQTFSISIKIGVAYGSAVSIVVSGADNYRDVILAGPAVDQATDAEHYAARGDIILDSSIMQHMPDLVVASVQDGFARLRQPPATLPKPDPTPDPMLTLAPDDYGDYVETLSPYIPPTVFRQLMMAQGDLPGDYRRISNIFLRFEGLDYTQSGVGQQLQDYVAWAYDIVLRFGGTLLRVLTGDKGSGLHITFGAPDKHADDIERAMRCALALRDDPQRPAYIQHQTFGLASGLVFASQVGSPARREYTVIGDEVNLSARLMVATAPNSILIDDYSYRRVKDQFEFETLPPLSVKGKTEPIAAHTLLRERVSETGLAARFRTERRPLVGRDQELTRLFRAADLALQGKGQVIVLAGDPGIGKTRLMQEVVKRWLSQRTVGIMGQCNPHLRNAPYHPWISLWHDFFHLQSHEDTTTWQDKIQHITSYIAPDMLDWVDSLGALLGLPIPEETKLAGLDAEARHQKLRQLSLALLQGRAQKQPLLLLLEDVHWIDQASVNLIDHIAERIKNHPVLLCLTYRSTHNVPVEAIALPHCTWLTLEPLQADDIEPLIEAMIGQVTISPEIRQAMYDKTRGNPVYVEEIIGHLKSTGGLKQDADHYILADEAQLSTIPDTLQDLVTAHLDRLDTETRDLAQVASVIDREFFFDLLQAVYPYPITELQMRQRLDALVYADITAVTHPGRNAGYHFKHSLTYEIAYDRLAYARRRELHLRAAKAIEAQNQLSLEEHYSALVRHYHYAEAYDRALYYSIEAGGRAQQLYANATALQNYEQAEAYLDRLAVDDCWSQVIALYLNRAQLHRLNGDFEAAHADVEQALQLAEAHQDTGNQAKAHNLKAEFAFYQENGSQLQTEARQAYALAQANEHLPEQATALYHLGVGDMLDGEFDQAMPHFQQAYHMSKTIKDKALESEILNKMALVWFFDGHLAQSLEAYQLVRAARQRLGLKDKEAEVLSNIANLEFRLNRPQQALETARQSTQLAKDAGWQMLIPYVQLLQVEILAYLGEYDQAEALMGNTYPLFDPNDRVGLAYAKLTHGREILIDLSRLDDATHLLEDSLLVMRQHHIFEEIARTLAGLGTISTRQKDWDQAEQYLQEAKSICLERHKSWYLSEVYARLAEVLFHQGKTKEAMAAIRTGELVIRKRSNPDWQGRLLFLQAQIVSQNGQPEQEALRLYIQAIEHSRARSRAIERNRLFIHAGTHLLNHDNPKVRKGAERLIQEGMAWLEARSEAALHR